MTENNTTKTPKTISNLPDFWQDILGGLLVAYASSHESMRFIIARDLAGFVRSLLLYANAYELPCKKHKTEDTTYGKLADDAITKINNALLLYRDGGSPGAALIELGDATDNLKEIIICREMIKEGFELRSDPLGAQNLESDIQSKNYRRI